MASEKALYWMAVGVLSLVIGNHFVGKFNGECLASRAQAAADRLSARAERLMAAADVTLDRTSTRLDRAQAAMVMTQARVASIQTSYAREQAACARVQAVRARLMVRERLQQIQIPASAQHPDVRVFVPSQVIAVGHDPL